MTTRVILKDGRTVRTQDECLDTEHALCGPHWISHPVVFSLGLPSDEWAVECFCCDARGEHPWSPSGQGVDPDEGHYICDPCCGDGHFRIRMP
jgi:hypothetical protein